MNFNDFSTQDGSENDPKLAQDHSKTVPRVIIFHVDFEINTTKSIQNPTFPIFHAWQFELGFGSEPSSVYTACRAKAQDTEAPAKVLN